MKFLIDAAPRARSLLSHLVAFLFIHARLIDSGSSFGSSTAAPARLVILTEGFGVVQKTPDKPDYAIGEEITLTATADRYGQFNRWSDGLTSSVRTVLIDTNRIYVFTAVFTNNLPLEYFPYVDWSTSALGTSAPFTYLTDTLDGGVLAGGAQNSVDYSAAKFDLHHNREWFVTFGKPGIDRLDALAELPSRTVLLLGNASSVTDPNILATTNQVPWVISIDADGRKLFEYSPSTSPTGSPLGATSWAVRANGDVVIIRNPFVSLFDRNGLLLWTRPSPGTINCMAQGPDDSLIIAGSRGASTWAALLDADGNLQWSRTYSSGTIPYVVHWGDSGFLFKCNGTAGELLRTDRNGNLIWQKNLPEVSGLGAATLPVSSMTRTADGGFAILKGAFKGSSAEFVFRLDTEGNTLWVQPPPSPIKFSRILPARSGLFLFTGDFATGAAVIGQMNEIRVPVGAPRLSVNGTPTAATNIFLTASAQIAWASSYPNGSIFYTLDGSKPNLTSTRYDSAFSISQSSLLRAVAFTADFLTSTEADPVYISFAPPVPTYTVSAISPGGGVIEQGSVDNHYLSNSLVHLTAKPLAGWSFLGWTGDIVSTNSIIDFQVNRSMALQANFGTSLSATVAGFGAVNFDPLLKLYPYGSSVTLTAVPQPDHFLAAWGNAATGTNNPLNFLITAPNQVISAAFLPRPTPLFHLETFVIGDGSISVSPALNLYPSGTNVLLTALPAPGNVFVSWSGDAAGTNPNFLLLMDTNKEATAIFRAIEDAAPGPVIVSTVAGSGIQGNLDAANPLTGTLNSPDGPSVAADGTIYFADIGNNDIRSLALSSGLGTFAGAGHVGYLDAAGTSALFSYPIGTCVLASGDILVADAENDVIRRIATNRTVSTFSGSGARGYLNGLATSVRFAFPNDLVEGKDGSIYVTEFQNHVVRKLGTNGDATTLAGSGLPGYADGKGLTAQFNQPAGITIALDGALFVTEWSNHRVRKIAPDGTVTTVAGSGVPGFRNGRSGEAQFNNPNGIAAARNGDLYVADTSNHSVRRISAGGTVYNLAGAGHPGFADGDQTVAAFNAPSGIAITPEGSLIVTDTLNHRIRKIAFARPPILTLQLLPGIGQSFAFQLQARGDPSIQIAIQISEDLRTWREVRPVTIGPAGSFSMFAVADAHANFYRAIIVPK